MTLRSIYFSAIAALSALLACSSARADFELTIFEGSSLIYDSGNVPGNPPQSATYTFTSGDIAVGSITVGSSSQTAIAGTLTLNNINIVTSNAVSNLTISISQTNYTQPIAGELFASGRITSLSDTLGGATATYTAYADPNNGSFFTGSGTAGVAFVAPGTAVSPGAVTASAPASGASSGQAPFSPVGGTYSLGGQFVLTNLASGTTVNASALTQAVAPEPGTLAIFASGLPLLGLLAARRRRKTTIAA